MRVRTQCGPTLTGPVVARQVPSVQIGSARGMTTGQDQTQTLHEAANRTRAGVVDPRFAHDVDEAIQSFGSRPGLPRRSPRHRRAVRALGAVARQVGARRGARAAGPRGPGVGADRGAGPDHPAQAARRRGGGRRPVRRDHALDRLRAAPQRARQALRGHDGRPDDVRRHAAPRPPRPRAPPPCSRPRWSSARTASARSTRAPTSARTAATTSARSPSARRSSGSSSRCCCSCCCC